MEKDKNFAELLEVLIHFVRTYSSRPIHHQQIIFYTNVIPAIPARSKKLCVILTNLFSLLHRNANILN